MKAKKKPLLKTPIGRITIVLVLILIAGSGYFYYRASSRNQSATTNVQTLQTTKAAVGDLVLYASGTGTVSPAAESNFGFNTSGQVSKVNVQIGDQVKIGDVLAQLDDTSAKIKLEQAKEAMDKLTSDASIATATQSLADAQISFDAAKKTLEYLISPEVLYWEEKVTEREQVSTDAQADLQSDASDVTKQKVSEAETSLKYAQDTLAHFQQVYTYKYAPETFTKTRTVRVVQTNQAVPRVVEKEEPVEVEDPLTGELVIAYYPPTEGEIAMARADYDLAKASIAEAQMYLDVLNGKEIPEGATGENLVTYIQTKHALQIAEYDLKATQLIAPINGTVTTLDIHAGDLTNGNTVVAVSNLDQPYSLDAYLDAEDWGQIQTGYNVEVNFDILPDRVFKGTVTNVYPTLDIESSNSALIHFTARLNDVQNVKLPSGAAASVDVIGGEVKNAVLVPVEALREFGDGQYALFVMQNGKLRLRVVEVGLQDITKAEIISGLNTGDIVSTGLVKTK